MQTQAQAIERKADIIRLQAAKLGFTPELAEQQVQVEMKGIVGLDNFRGEVWDTWGAFNRPLAHGIGADELVGKGSFGFSANSAVYACINTVATAYMEPLYPLLYRPNSDPNSIADWETVEDHPIYRLLRKPNQVRKPGRGRPIRKDYPTALSWPLMQWVAQWWKHVDGDAYFLKVRAGHPVTGNVVQLWPIGPHMMWPVTEAKKDPRNNHFIDYYAYAPVPEMQARPFKVDVRNVVHMRLGVDPRDIRHGLGPVKFLAREVATDENAQMFTDTLLRNYAMPGLIIIPEEGYIDEDEATELRGRLQALLGLQSGGTGKMAFLSGKAKVEEVGFDPDRMALAQIHRHVEERIAAVMNIPAMVAQLGAGLQQASQFTNFHEAREMMAENTMLPLFLADGLTLTEQLLTDFRTEDGWELRYDPNRLRALQADVTEKVGRLQVAVKGGWMTANEARAKIGLQPIDRKVDEVPLTQGQDNRLNELLQGGGITINEARESVGMPAIPGGDKTMGGGSVGDSPADRLAPNIQIEDPNSIPRQLMPPKRPGSDLGPREPRGPTRGGDVQAKFDQMVLALTEDELHAFVVKYGSVAEALAANAIP